jgi:hypothetical protein
MVRHFSKIPLPTDINWFLNINNTWIFTARKGDPVTLWLVTMGILSSKASVGHSGGAWPCMMTLATIGYCDHLPKISFAMVGTGICTGCAFLSLPISFIGTFVCTALDALQELTEMSGQRWLLTSFQLVNNLVNVISHSFISTSSSTRKLHLLGG